MRLKHKVEMLENTVERLNRDLTRLEAKVPPMDQAIDQLKDEVLKNSKDKKISSLWHFYWDSSDSREATLAGKVNAIVNHLGLDLTVKPGATTPSTVVATKKKVTTKKKGKK